ncbi:MAG: lysophospholipid acyltransferase family protein [Chloroflexota bacterium]
MADQIKYPRNQFIRKTFQVIARGLLKILTRTRITGLENYPEDGPLIVVGNHTGVLEVVLMAAHTPRLIEFMGSVDIPHESFLAVFVDAYGCIPVKRGNVSRAAMQSGIEVLKQDGVIGLFPEGGIWEPEIRRAQTGVSWLSYHAQAPVLPIGFSSMQGALNKAFTFKFPELVMNIGELIPPVELTAGAPRKTQLQDAAQRIIDQVYELIPEADRQPEARLIDERFEFLLTVKNGVGTEQPIPDQFKVRHGYYFVKFLHRATLFNTLRDNLKLPIQALKEMRRKPAPVEIIAAAQPILDYLENENPYYFTYRYGQKDGGRFTKGIREVRDLAEWVQKKGYSLEIIPRRRYWLADEDDEVIDDIPKDIKKL